jgi:hypothetical protein
MRTLVLVGLFACDAGAPNIPAPQAPVANPHAAQELADGFQSEILGSLSPQPISAGAFAMAIDVSFNLDDYRAAVHGWMTLELGPDGRASACVAAETIDDRPAKKTASVWVGTWKLVDGIARVEFDQVALLARSCHPAKADDSLYFEAVAGAPTLRCIATGANDKLPADAIACRESDLPELGMPTIRGELPSNNTRPRGTGLVLSRTGIHVEVEQQNAQAPTYSFAPDAVDIELAFAKLRRHKFML